MTETHAPPSELPPRDWLLTRPTEEALPTRLDPQLHGTPADPKQKPHLGQGDPKETNLRYRASTRELIQGPRGLPLVKPPYGRITAIDLNRGELKWTIANGDGPRFHPELKALNLPPLGQSVRAAPLVTKTLLFVTEGDQINVRTPPNGGGRKIRAYDKATGQVLWETALEAGSTGTLMTYLHKGKQYVVVAIGGIQHPAEFVAFSQP